MKNAIDQQILSQPVEGVNITPGTFRDQLPDCRVIVFFLRHFG
jgi:hypothetical protein